MAKLSIVVMSQTPLLHGGTASAQSIPAVAIGPISVAAGTAAGLAAAAPSYPGIARDVAAMNGASAGARAVLAINRAATMAEIVTIETMAVLTAAAIAAQQVSPSPDNGK